MAARGVYFARCQPWLSAKSCILIGSIPTVQGQLVWMVENKHNSRELKAIYNHIH